MQKNLIVSDELSELESSNFQAISFETYLRDYPKKGEPKTRVINLCNVDTYLSQGYYCSLLAEARQHQALPSVKVINALRPKQNSETLSLNVTHMHLSFTDPITFFVFFGMSSDPIYSKLATYIFRTYPSPILRITLNSDKGSQTANIERLSISNLPLDIKPLFYEHLSRFTQTVWKTQAGNRKLRWDLAILVNPDEQSPPSNKQALDRFVKAARQLSIKAHLVTSAQLTDLTHYDALFIRETTAIDHHTYELAVRAEDAGLVVIDDSQSILRCCNKAFLHDAFSYQKVPTPRTRILHKVTEQTIDELIAEFEFPMVLKLPEGSFSRGVYKVNNSDEFNNRLEEIFQMSALVLVQEYMYTEYDWRIGILNGRPLYACRYKMARNHWQIYNHGAKTGTSGGFDTLPTFEVPKVVLDVALKAANIVGNSLYGVDIKVKDGKPYVLEVNDNPSIEHKVEDAYLGKELYMQIMAEFQQRLEARGKS